MNGFVSAFSVEILKARRSKVPFFSALGFSIAPLVGALFMIILKDPEAAKSMGLISAKAQLSAGTADWSSFFSILGQATAVGGLILFSIVAAWVFGREFADRTAKELLALPTSRASIIAAKFALVAIWAFSLTVMIYIIGIFAAANIGIPGWSDELFKASIVDIFGASVLTISLLPYVALVASLGRGYMPAFGWAVLSVVLAQIAAITGWGDWFPWAIPALFVGAAGPRPEMLGNHSYFVIAVASIIGATAVFLWWQYADQTK